MFWGKNIDFKIPALRRKELLAEIKTQFPAVKKGLIVLSAGFENDRIKFRQESSFYYFTHVTEPAVILTIDFSGQTTLFVPNCSTQRAAWMASTIVLDQNNAQQLHIDKIVPLGKIMATYQMQLFSPLDYYEDFIKFVTQEVIAGSSIFTLAPQQGNEYTEQKIILSRLMGAISRLSEKIVDISAQVAHLRMYKSTQEIESLQKAVEITIMAQEAAASAIKEGYSESEVQASLEYMMTSAQARIAFPSIVASGKMSTILHYQDNMQILESGDLVVVDIGAEYEYYCADITRTYPVSGKFTKRQKEIYNLVLETQNYIADLAKPGMYLNNKDQQSKSLHHLAKEFLRQRGYADYFTHGIGHYLGLDVHDVGDYKKPLEEGIVFTIEPGIYIPQEKIGVRIEDDYWIVNDDALCLSDALPKNAEDIEIMLHEQATTQVPEEDISEFEFLEEH